MVPRPLLPLAVAAALLAAACTGTPDAAPTAARNPAPAETPHTGTATPSPSPSAPVPVPDYATADCDDPPVGFDLLCEVHELIVERHLEPPDDRTLAEAAAAALPPTNPRPDGELTCALPSDDFRVLCDAIARHDGGLADTVEEAVDHMIRALDPYSDYQDPLDRQLAAEQRDGTVEGIGALVTTRRVPEPEVPAEERCSVLGDDCEMVIVSVFEDSPAAGAGLVEDDVMVSVDGEAVDGFSLEEIVSKVRGPAGTDVELGIRRDGSVLTVTITRAAIDLTIVETAQPSEDVGYLRLNLFTSDADERVEEALRELLRADPDTILFDLRGDPGGALDAAVSIASEFLSGGLVLKTESPGESHPYSVEPGGLATGSSPELIVLVDEGSASASEVVAGALQEAGRAILVGESTFGKNTVQSTYPLDNGGALKLTVAQWVTPSGRDFGQVGITPDVELDLPPDLEPDEIAERVLDAVAAAQPTATQPSEEPSPWACACSASSGVA